ncbi:MAG: hypothetical protein Q4F31_09370 [Eubacteriales bacterium]|nr:hypothetical protein [Eubacteriales bacterium]
MHSTLFLDPPEKRPEDLITDAWKYYELGKLFNSSMRPDLYKTVDTNNEFFNGNQWINLPDNDAMRRLPKPVFNILKRITSLFVASLSSSGTTLSFDPYVGQLDDEATNIANEEVRNILEKLKIDYRIRDALFDGAITGDYCAHFYWDANAKPFGGTYRDCLGEVKMELVDGINVMFGNPNVREVEKQPYILIIGRDTVENLKAEAIRWRKVTQNVSETGAGNEPPDGSAEPNISGDYEENHDTPHGYNEIRGDDDKSTKALYLYLYTKQRTAVPVMDGDGRVHLETRETVHVTKATRTAVIFSGVNTGLSRYPVAWGNWQRQKNCYHGRALVSEVIPNQIIINQMIAMAFRHLQTQAFPTKVFNADVLPGISNEVGTAIGVRNLMPGQTLGSVVTTLPAADMSNQIIQAIELAMNYTKECLGATDAQLGNLTATNTSALMVLQNSSEIPLENIRSGLYEWIEDIGGILLDMLGTYYGKRPVVREVDGTEPVLGADGQQLPDPVTGQPATVPAKVKKVVEFDFSVFKRLYYSVRVNVGPTNYYSEIAAVQSLDNLRRDGVLDIIDYLERVPDSLISRKDELIGKLKEQRETAQAQQQMMNAGAPGTGGYAVSGPLDEQKKLAALPANLQVQYGKLPNKARNALMSYAGR